MLAVSKVECRVNPIYIEYFNLIKMVNSREQTIWEILEFCYRNQILGLIYRIRADAHGILVFTC